MSEFFSRFILICRSLSHPCSCDNAWKCLQTDPGDSSFYNPYVNVPFGLAHYGNKLFVTVARRNPGIPSSLNVVELTGNPPYINPPLISYPNWNMNTLMVSIFYKLLFFVWLLLAALFIMAVKLIQLKIKINKKIPFVFDCFII
jgi:hypothetical protein